MPLQNWLPRPPVFTHLPHGQCRDLPCAKALPCPGLWRAPRPPRRATFLQPGTHGAEAKCRPAPRSPGPASGDPGPQVSYPGPGTPGFLPLPGLFRALPQPLSCSEGPGQTVPTVRSLPRLGPAPPHPRAPAAPPCGQGSRPRSPGSCVGATRSCYRWPAPLSTGLWALWVGFSPLPANAHCENRGTTCSRGAKGGGSASQRPQRDPGQRSRHPTEARWAWAGGSLTALPSSPELGAAPGWAGQPPPSQVASGDLSLARSSPGRCGAPLTPVDSWRCLAAVPGPAGPRGLSCVSFRGWRTPS